MKKPLIILTGPTAVGKTKLSISLAKAVNGAIISADSMQVYRHMEIGSAKIRPEEMCGVPHYLIDVLDPSEEFHVVKFVELAHEAMEKIYAAGQIPIVTGGTGFYIQALLKEVDFTESHGELPIRKQLEEKAATEEGAAELYRELSEVDPASAETIHPNNVKRVIRALEYYHETGQKISEHNEEQKQKESPYCSAYFVLNDERSILYDRIDRRVDQMIRYGLFERNGIHKRSCLHAGTGLQRTVPVSCGRMHAGGGRLYHQAGHPSFCQTAADLVPTGKGCDLAEQAGF